MIIEIYFLLLALSAFLIILSYWTGNNYIGMFGLVLMLILAITLESSGIAYKTGENITSYTDPVTNYTHTSTADFYGTYKNHTIGFYLAVLCILGFVQLIITNGERR
jgi:hypothetical protein